MENIKVDVIPQEESQAIFDWLKDWVERVRKENQDEPTIPKEKLEEYLTSVQIKNVHLK